MASTASWQGRLTQTGRAAQRWVIEWWRLVHLGALILVLTLSPSSYNRESRLVLSRHIYLNTAPILLGFTVLCALVTVVLTRIVLVTALSYGLSQYALQVVIRVLVLELIPLTAALFVALRCTIAGLFVAVPSVLAHTYFVRRVDALAVKVESIMQETIQHFYQHFEVQRPAA